ncbi:hypothetical protein N9267_00450 [bacterium]|nr:hypothetical protein [bacterium]
MSKDADFSTIIGLEVDSVGEIPTTAIKIATASVAVSIGGIARYPFAAEPRLTPVDTVEPLESDFTRGAISIQICISDRQS